MDRADHVPRPTPSPKGTPKRGYRCMDCLDFRTVVTTLPDGRQDEQPCHCTQTQGER